LCLRPETDFLFQTSIPEEHEALSSQGTAGIFWC